MGVVTDLLTRVRNRAFKPVDNASLIFFRIAFGLLMIWEVWLYFSHHWITRFWVEPRFFFKFYGFSWIQPWPGNGLYIHWAVLGVLACFITVGFLYRASAALFFLGFTYIFLLDEAQYLGHAYLICLFSFLMIFVPAHRSLSIDAWLNPKLRSQTTPAWALWLLCTQIGVVYFFSGIAKISPDWFQGELMRSRLARQTDFPFIGRFFREEWLVYTASYGALLLDLFIVPLLLWRRTRLAAFCAAVIFHLLNARLFVIGVFPWLSIAATALFFPPNWPRRALSIFGARVRSAATTAEKMPGEQKQLVVLSLVAIYIAIQLLVPLRHFLYRGGLEWIYAEHRFSWRLMVQSVAMRAFFYVMDPNSGATVQVVPAQFLNRRQVIRMAGRPDMILQFAHHLAEVMPRSGPKPLRVEARVFISFNDRKPQLYIDPNVDLAAEPRTLGRPRWLLEIHGPLPDRRDRSPESPAAGTFDEN
jgi:vitamin K-dependent gamma-carboxylase